MIKSEKNLQQIKTVELSIGQLEIKPLPVGKYIDVLRSIKELPKLIANVDTDNEKFISNLPELVAQFLPEIASILEVATGISKQDILENLSLNEVLDIVETVIEVNQFSEVFLKVRRMSDKFRPKAKD